MKTAGMFNKAFIFLAALLIVGALLLFQLHIGRPGAEPKNATTEFMNAVATADLESMRAASAPPFYDDFVHHFGRRKFESVQNNYQLLYQNGLPTWRDYRRKAELLAQREYELLLLQIAQLGRKKFQQLPLEERMKLMDDNTKFDAFISQAGIQELPAEVKNKIDDLGKFRSREGRSRFIERECFNVLPEEDQKVLGSSSTLSMSDTTEKLAFIDKYGMVYLSESQKKEISGIPRSELDNPSLFISKYGEALAKAFLENLQLQWSLPLKPCSFPAQDTRGSLVRGSEAVCLLITFSKKSQENNAKDSKNLSLILQKRGFRWIVLGLQPNLYQLY